MRVFDRVHHDRSWLRPGRGARLCWLAGVGAGSLLACTDGSLDPIKGAGGSSGSTDAAGGPAGGGHAGHGGASGSGADGGSACFPGNDELLPDDGYIEDGLGTKIFGPWYTFGCEGATISPAQGTSVSAVNGEICFSGSVPAAPNDPETELPNYSEYYGAAVGFDLCGMPSGDEDHDDIADVLENCWLPARYCRYLENGTFVPGGKYTIGECDIDFDTISLVITGAAVPEDLRIVFKELESGPEVDGARPQRLESTYLTANGEGCFSGEVADATVRYDPEAPPLDKTAIGAIHFHVPTNPEAAVPFNFCISALSLR